MAEPSLLESLLNSLLATDDPTEKAAIVAESAFAQLPTTVALVAQRCTILRWFDATIIAALVDMLPPAERPAVVQHAVATLTSLPFVEHLAWGFTYHDQTRAGLLRRTPPGVLQHAAALAIPGYNAHANLSLARVEALYCAVVSGQMEVAAQTLDALLEDASRREDWQALLTTFQALDEASALPFTASMPRTTLHYFLRGLARHELGDLAGAIADFDQAIALHPTDASPYNNRGIARRGQGDLAGAIADFDQAITLHPAHANAYYNRGIARRDQGDLAGAIADYDQAIALHPTDASAYINRGIARRGQGDLAGAIADYDQAITLHPTDASAYINRGVARSAQGDLAGSIADFDQAITLNPTDVDAYYNRGIARSAQGDLAGAIADYNQYLALGGDMSDGDQEELEQRIHALRVKLDGGRP